MDACPSVSFRESNRQGGTVREVGFGFHDSKQPELDETVVVLIVANRASPGTHVPTEKDFHRTIGHPSVVPEPMIRMLVIGYRIGSQAHALSIRWVI
jgi:hypothetical protein